jgi:hypothetical protein
MASNLVEASTVPPFVSGRLRRGAQMVSSAGYPLEIL